MTTELVFDDGWREARHDGIDCKNPMLQVFGDRSGVWFDRLVRGEPLLPNYRYRVPIEPAVTDDCVGECFDCGGPISREKGCPPCDLPPLVEPEWYYLVQGDIMSANDEYEQWIGWWQDSTHPASWSPSTADSDSVGKPFDPNRFAPRRRRVTKPEPVEPVTETTPVQNAMATLSEAMFKDSDYAWTWHCNVAMAAWDAGAPICEANERAADFIKNAFGVDVRALDEWKNMPMKIVDTVPLVESNTATNDPVHIPAHYTQGPIECVDWVRLALTDEEYRGWLKGDALAYIFRERLKGGDQDLDKASRYLTFHHRPKVTPSTP